jgi:hypothetical protein
MDDVFSLLHALWRISRFENFKIFTSKVYHKHLVYFGKVLDVKTTTQFVDLWCCCMDVNDFTRHAFSFGD